MIKKGSDNSDKRKLTAPEKRLIETLLGGNFDITHTDRIYEKANISKAVYEKCMEDEEFLNILRQKSLERINRDVLEVIKIFKEKAIEGSFNHGKAMLELAGYYKKGGQEEKKVEKIYYVSHIPRDDEEGA